MKQKQRFSAKKALRQADLRRIVRHLNAMYTDFKGKHMSKKARIRSNLDGLVREKLRESILTGVIANGTHLSEIKISEQFGVSRTPVREALCALAADGLVVMHPNRGAFVNAPSADSMADRSSTHGLLVSLVAGSTVGRLPEMEAARLEKFVSSLQTADSSEFSSISSEIFGLIGKFCPSASLVELVESSARRLSVSPLSNLSDSAVRSQIQQQFIALSSAMKRGQSDVAEKAVRDVFSLWLNPAASRTVGAA